ncbi:hypothetical protein Acy02nite_40110 [Actinoplanes cyaneus]|uniref:BMP family ABC transporter substrate-binding protein n=1 Tax=Actinoplanes cyaneus TaxID=52696 RepID=A0A919IQ90_9ACTN|nr:hypothetical protein [Actinoplanes cyaneus]MCW2139598.1 hypothetical protein [Actinoplanes cyaneus]GID66130.1 hypothetical protein Acy02nite_40110 [Actinoplanes cyaneus]
MRHPFRAVATLAAAAMLITGCGSGDEWSEPHAAPTPVGSLGPGFLAPSASPAPESTITPAPGSWSGVHPPEGYRVVLLTVGDDAPTKALVTAVNEWARSEKADLRTIVAGAHDPIASISEAIKLRPDLIVSAGDSLVDPLAIVTASHLDQQFLVVGAELAEPTGNVTAADWAGASFRGEGLGSASTYDPASFTAERCGNAVRAGVAAVLHKVTGIIVWLR